MKPGRERAYVLRAEPKLTAQSWWRCCKMKRFAKTFSFSPHFIFIHSPPVSQSQHDSQIFNKANVATYIKLSGMWWSWKEKAKSLLIFSFFLVQFHFSKQSSISTWCFWFKVIMNNIYFMQTTRKNNSLYYLHALKKVKLPCHFFFFKVHIYTGFNQNLNLFFQFV